jgi:hypothetical protein
VSQLPGEPNFQIDASFMNQNEVTKLRAVPRIGGNTAAPKEIFLERAVDATYARSKSVKCLRCLVQDQLGHSTNVGTPQEASIAKWLELYT